MIQCTTTASNISCNEYIITVDTKIYKTYAIGSLAMHYSDQKADFCECDVVSLSHLSLLIQVRPHINICNSANCYVSRNQNNYLHSRYSFNIKKVIT